MDEYFKGADHEEGQSRRAIRVQNLAMRIQGCYKHYASTPTALSACCMILCEDADKATCMWLRQPTASCQKD